MGVAFQASGGAPIVCPASSGPAASEELAGAAAPQQFSREVSYGPYGRVNIDPDDDTDARVADFIGGHHAESTTEADEQDWSDTTQNPTSYGTWTSNGLRFHWVRLGRKWPTTL